MRFAVAFRARLLSATLGGFRCLTPSNLPDRTRAGVVASLTCHFSISRVVRSLTAFNPNLGRICPSIVIFVILRPEGFLCASYQTR